MKMTTEEAFVKTLQMHGIEHAFGIIGSAMMPISDIFGEAGITFWDCAHEGSGGMMADPMMPNACSIPCICRVLTKASSVVIFIGKSPLGCSENGRRNGPCLSGLLIGEFGGCKLGPTTQQG